MSMYIVIDTGEPMFFASNSGWAELGHWIDSLDVKTYPDLVHFREYGWTEPAPMLERELLAAMKDHPPPDEDSRQVARELAELVAGAADDAVVLLSNGIVSADDEPDEEEAKAKPTPAGKGKAKPVTRPPAKKPAKAKAGKKKNRPYQSTPTKTKGGKKGKGS